jgi:hypothetical protein
MMSTVVYFYLGINFGGNPRDVGNYVNKERLGFGFRIIVIY